MKDKETIRLFRINDKIFAEVSWSQLRESWVTNIYVWGEGGPWSEYRGMHSSSPLKSFKSSRLQMRLDRDPEFKKVYDRMSGKKQDNINIGTELSKRLFELKSAMLVGHTTYGELVEIQKEEKYGK